MATNLRLRPDAAEAVRTEAKRSGRSQQDVIRDAVDRQLGLDASAGHRGQLHALVATGEVRPPREPYRAPTARYAIPARLTTLALLERDDRLSG